MRTPAGYLFELTGGRLCLDLANTVDERASDQPIELLERYQDLLDWGAQAGAVTRAEAAALAAEALRRPAAAAAALGRTRQLRESLFCVCRAAAKGRAISHGALSALNRAIAGSLANRQIVQRGRRLALAWRENDRPNLDRVLWAAAASAADLLASPFLARVKICPGAGCAWLFLDRSRNGTRRWCDMSVCGNRAKARRHYARVRREKGGQARPGPSTG
jgi:predicted RNA-binding Zn ribbon-like protein